MLDFWRAPVAVRASYQRIGVRVSLFQGCLAKKFESFRLYCSGFVSKDLTFPSPEADLTMTIASFQVKGLKPVGIYVFWIHM